MSLTGRNVPNVWSVLPNNVPRVCVGVSETYDRDLRFLTRGRDETEASRKRFWDETSETISLLRIRSTLLLLSSIAVIHPNSISPDPRWTMHTTVKSSLYQRTFSMRIKLWIAADLDLKLQPLAYKSNALRRSIGPTKLKVRGMRYSLAVAHQSSSPTLFDLLWSY